MTRKFSITKWQLGVGFAAFLSMSASAATIYDNSANPLSPHFLFSPSPATLEVGDEIIVTGGAGQYLTRFTFQFYGTNNTGSGGPFAGTVQARVRFYENNGVLFNGYPTPGLLPFYDSGLFGVPTTDLFGVSTFEFLAGGPTFDFPNGGLLLPAADFTWSVQFSGMIGSDAVGVEIYDPLVAGSNYPDYWENNGVSWELKTNIVNMNFAATFETPEPSTVALLALGGLGFLYASRRSRKP